MNAVDGYQKDRGLHSSGAKADRPRYGTATGSVFKSDALVGRDRGVLRNPGRRWSPSAPGSCYPPVWPATRDAGDSVAIAGWCRLFRKREVATAR